jgi:hypothetical protein
MRKIPNSISHLKHLKDNCPDVVTHVTINDNNKEKEYSFKIVFLIELGILIALYLVEFLICK